MRILSLSLLLLASCGEKKPPVVATPVDVSALYLEPTPAVVGRMTIVRDDRKWAGPARVAVQNPRSPLRLTAEDLELAELVEIEVTSDTPTEFAQVAGTIAADVGTLSRDGDRLSVAFDRSLPTETPMHVELHVDQAPVAVDAPDDWLRPGTTLYYGVSYDDKPITHVVPMAFTVRVGAGSDGSRMLSWSADIDPNRLLDVTYDRIKTGRRQVPAEQVEGGVRHSDAFLRGNDIGDATSIFLSRKTLADLHALGGAAFHDLEVSDTEGVLVRKAELDVTVQVDDGLWTLSTLVALAHGGDGTYVIADDADHPLLLSAKRPGYGMKLMAIGQP
jgi:hypothetical protein